MKWMITSDIHGSSFYCKKMLDCFEKENSDRLIILGDILYHGPRNNLPKDYAPKEVASMLNNIKDKILCVRGNCDAEVDQMMLDFPILADYAVIDTGKHLIYATHGSVFNNFNLPPLQKGDVLLYGHTHVPTLKKSNGLYYLNPGSVSIPKDESVPSYLVFENDTFTLKSLDGKTIEIFPLD